MIQLNKLLGKFSLTKSTMKQYDNRSYRFICVIDCILNQNTRDSGAAQFPALNYQLVQLCHQYNVGIMQMPCPEIAFLGFNRSRPPGTSIRTALDTSDGRLCCRKLSIDIIDRVEEVISQGAEFMAVLGGNPESPGCAVPVDNNEKLTPAGVLITELKDELYKRNIQVPIRAIRDFDEKLMADDIQWLEHLFTKN